MDQFTHIMEIAASNQGGFILCLFGMYFMYKRLRECESKHAEASQANKDLNRRCIQLETQLMRLNPDVESIKQSLNKLNIGEFDFIK